MLFNYLSGSRSRSSKTPSLRGNVSLSDQNIVDDINRYEKNKETIKEWTSKNYERAKEIALYCNTPSDKKKEEVERLGCQFYDNCNDDVKKILLADFKQDCILAKINGQKFDMGTMNEVGTYEQQTGGKTRKPRQRRRHRFSEKSGKRKRGTRKN
jgi:hypothetical protein